MKCSPTPTCNSSPPPRCRASGPPRLPRDGCGQGLFHRQDALHDARPARRRAPQASRDTSANTWCIFRERLHVEARMSRGSSSGQGAIGRVVQVIGLGPHRLRSGQSPGVVFGAGEVRRHPHRHRQPPVRAVPHLHAARRARSRACGGRELSPQDNPEFEDWGEAILSPTTARRITFAWTGSTRRAAHVGRRAHVHPRHRGLHRAAEIPRRRDGGGGRSALPRRQRTASNTSAATAKSASRSSASSSSTA